MRPPETRTAHGSNGGRAASPLQVCPATLAALADGDRAFIDALLNRTPARPEIFAAVR